MKITNKNIIWIIIGTLDICTATILFSITWNLSSVWPVIGVMLTCAMLALNGGLMTSFIIDCLNDDTKFEYEIPIPFRSYFNNRKKHKKLNQSIEDLKLEIAECKDDDCIEKLYIKLKVLQGVNLTEI